MGAIARAIGGGVSNYRTPKEWLIDALGGASSTSGIRVNPDVAMTYTAFFACVDAIARGVAQLPLKVYKTRNDNGRVEAKQNQAYRLLHNRPNADMTPYQLKHYVMTCVLTWGNGYIEMIQDGRQVVELFPISPENVELKRNDDNELFLQIREGEGSYRNLLARNVIHVHGIGNGIEGYSPVRLFRETIGLGLAEEKFGAAFFGNNSQFGGTLEHPGRLSEEAQMRLRKQVEGDHQGAAKAFRLKVLEEGMTYKQIGVPPEDAQFIESRRFGIEEIARIFHVPPHKIQELTHATFSNIEHQNIEWVVDTLGPWLTCWEEEINAKLLTPDGDYYAEFLVNSLLRGDQASRSAYYREMYNIGVMSQNDIRRAENLNPIDGGDRYFVPLNMIPVDKLDEQLDARLPQPAPETIPVDDDTERVARIVDTHRVLLSDICKRIVNREIGAVRKAAKREYSYRKTLDTFYDDHRTYIRIALMNAVLAFNAALGNSDNRSGISVYCTEIASRHCDLNKSRLARIENVETVTNELSETYAAALVERIVEDIRNVH